MLVWYHQIDNAKSVIGAARGADYARAGAGPSLEEIPGSARQVAPAPSSCAAASRRTQRPPSFTHTWNGRSTSANTNFSVMARL